MSVVAAKTRNDLRRVRVAVAVPDGQEETGARLDLLARFCVALSDAMGAIVVHAQGIRRYREVIAAIRQGDTDVAWLPPVLAARAVAADEAIPIALPLRAGQSSYTAALFTRDDGPIQSVADLAGARAAWVDRDSAAGYLVSRASLRAQGVDLGRALGEEHFLGSHEAVVRAVLGGSADVGATFAHLDPATQTIIGGGWGDAAVRVIDRAGPIPSDVLAASRFLPPPLRLSVQRALIDEPTDALREIARALFGAEGFVEARPEHLDPLNHLMSYLEDAS